MTLIHIIWKGKGWLVPAITFGCSLVAEIITRLVTGDDTLYQTSPYLLAIALLVAGVIIFFVSRKNKATDQSADKNYSSGNGKNTSSNSFFFVPMEYWTWVLLAASVVTIIVRSS